MYKYVNIPDNLTEYIYKYAAVIYLQVWIKIL